MTKVAIVKTYSGDDAPFYVLDEELIGYGHNFAPNTLARDGRDPAEVLIEKFPYGLVRYAEFDAGSCAPRVWRTPPWKEAPPLEATAHFNAMINGIQQAEVLTDSLEQIFRVVHPAAETSSAYGTEIRNLLILACTEVEAQLKAILVANNIDASGRNYCTNDYVKLLEPLGLAHFGRGLCRYPEYEEIWPFRTWESAAASKSLLWYQAYNEAKHDREGKFREATLGHAVSAVAAVDIMLRAQFGAVVLEKHQTRSAFRTLADKKWGEIDGYHPPPPRETWRFVSLTL